MDDHTETTRDGARKATVWAICEYYPPNFSGAAIQAQRILSRLVQRGHQVVVLTWADHAAAERSGQCIDQDGVRVDYVPVIRLRSWDKLRRMARLRQFVLEGNRKLRDLSFHWRLAWRVVRLTRRHDILQWYVISDYTWPVLALAHWLGRRNLIQISLVGADDPSSFPRGRWGIAARGKHHCFQLAERIITLSRALTTSCLTAGISESRIVQIPNGVDLPQFVERGSDRDQLCRALRLNPQRRYLVFVGSAIHRKGIDVAVRAFIQVAAARADVDLLVVGEADFHDRSRHPAEREALVNQLRDEAARAGVADRIHWVGLQPRVADYLRVAELFLFPTRREGLPNAMAEAMACGLPVIAADLKGITTDLVDSGIEGELVPNFDPIDYARAGREALDQPAEWRRRGQAARARIERDFSLDSVVDRYEALYLSVPPPPV